MADRASSDVFAVPQRQDQAWRFLESNVHCATVGHMRSPLKPGRVGVRELRQNLKLYLDRVKAGEVLEVTEHAHVVALFTPLPGKGSALQKMVATGRARPAAGDLLDLWPPLGRRPQRRAVRALRELRRTER